MADRVILSISDNMGYAPNQIETDVTLAMMRDTIAEMIDEYGEDTLVILGNGQRYGASYGQINTSYGQIAFVEPEEEDEDF